MKIIRFILMQQAIYLAQASTSIRGATEQDHGLIQRDIETTRQLNTSSSWSNILALICPPHLKHCPHHKDQKSSSSSSSSGSTEEEGSTSSVGTTSSATSTTDDTTETSSSSTSGTSSSSSASSVSSSTSSSSSGSSSTSSTSSTGTDDTVADEPSTVYYTTTDDSVVEEENSATKDIVNKIDLRFLYIVGAALLVGGLAMAVVQRRKRSTTNIEGGKSGLIDISEDSESAFVAMEMAGFDDTNNISNTRNTSTLSSDIYNDIDDVVVEYGVKM